MTTPRRRVSPVRAQRSLMLAACVLGATALAAPPADAPLVAQQDAAKAAAAPNPAVSPAPLPAAPPAPERIHGAFVGDEWRYPHHNILVRWLTDLVAIPTGFVTWSPQDALTFVAVSGTTLGLMVGEPLSGDVYVQRWAHETFGLRETRFTFWWPQTDVIIWSILGGTGLGVLAYGWWFDVPEYVEMISILLEGFSVAQVYHVLPKLLIGREGPMDGRGDAIVYGPTHSIRLYPAGTPSGHAASIYSVIGGLAMYTDNGWIVAAMHLAGAFLCTTMLIDDYHFLSDIIWGASMGYATAQWVVRHRSTRFKDESPGYPVRIIPVVDVKNGGAGVAMALAF